MMREALAVLLDLEADLSVVAQVGRGDEVLAAVNEHRPDVVLLDIELPGGSAAWTSRRPCAPRPPDTMVVIVTTFGRPGYLRRALDAGVPRLRGQGRSRGGPGGGDPAGRRWRAWSSIRVLAADALAAGPNPLTEREREVLRESAGRGHGGRHRRRPAPVRADGAQLPVCRDRQDRHPQPGRGGLRGAAPRLAVRRVRRSAPRPG